MESFHHWRNLVKLGNRVKIFSIITLPFMLGSGFFTAAIGEPLVMLVWPARPAGLGDAEAGRPGDSCNTKKAEQRTLACLNCSLLRKGKNTGSIEECHLG